MINIEYIRNHCIAKKGVTEGFPFDSDTLVFKVMNKMFLLINISDPSYFNVKCDAEKAVELREMYDAVKPGWHMNKSKWNTIDLSFDPPDDKVWEWIDHSYDEVVAGLPKKIQQQLKTM